MIYKCEYNIMETVLLRPVSYHRSKVLCSLAGLGQSKRTRIFFCTENTAQTFSSVLSVSSVVKFFDLMSLQCVLIYAIALPCWRILRDRLSPLNWRRFIIFLTTNGNRETKVER